MDNYFLSMETFPDIVDEVRKLRVSQLEKLELIVKGICIEKARKRLLKSHREAMAEEKAGKLTFSSDINFLKSN
jgi:phosphopantothenate synthetase